MSFFASDKRMNMMEFQITAWDEKPYFEDVDGSKLTRAGIVKSYEGELRGEGRAESLMTYRPDGSAWFMGIERVEGTIGGRTGSFVLSHEGSYVNGVANSTFKVVEGSGTSGLAGLSGEGRFSTGHGTSVPFEFTYTFADE